jgi:hypothetical protein
MCYVTPRGPLSLLASGYQGLFPSGKVAGREADYSPPSSAEVKEWMELYLHSPNTPSWRGARLQKSTGATLPLPYVTQNGRWTVDDELMKIWKETVIFYIIYLFHPRIWLEELRKPTKELGTAGLWVMILKPGASKLQIKSVKSNIVTFSFAFIKYVVSWPTMLHKLQFITYSGLCVAWRI